MTAPITRDGCVPYITFSPSGTKWMHSRRCSHHPNQPVGDEMTPERQAAIRALIEHPALGPNAAVADWLNHDEPGHVCGQNCRWVEHYLDEADDPELEEADGY